jgi:hypothetical protein
MPRQYRDDSPTAFNLGRREILLAGLASVGGLAALSTLPTISAPGTWSDESSAGFMEISSLLIPHRLNEEIGKRIGAAMSALNPSLSKHVTELLAIARKRTRGSSRTSSPKCRKVRSRRPRSRLYPPGILAS